ncbi:hypothetical protein QZH41_010611, partial [Actinostola sp. cb2023]
MCSYYKVFSILCRLTYALSLNFLAMIHLDGHVTGSVESVETSFTTREEEENMVKAE